MSALPVADILIVDDRPDDLQLLSSLLATQGYRVRSAASGDSALASVLADPPELILLDIALPGLNGYELCRRIKADDRVRLIPIIFVSARSDTADKVEAFANGGADYITKPFHETEIIVRIENQLRIGRLQQTLQQKLHDRLVEQSELESTNRDLEARVADRTAELQARQQELIVLQTRLEAALDKEHALNSLMAQLLETIAHEFSTPLSIINTATQMLKLNRSQNRIQNDDRCFHMINASVSRISQTLKNTMTLTTAESNALQFCPESLDLAQFCRTIVSTWKLPSGSGHRIEFLDQENDPETAIASVDVTLFRQLLTNLLQNAIRFSPQGGLVQLQLEIKPVEFILRVRDFGIGIPTAEQSQVFKQFYRASNANSVPGTPGVGLGLAVVQQIVRLHGGTVALESKLGQGTIVAVTLPRL